ncbi:MAG: hypothetical protein AB8E82_12000 [Aureispira sp.]
MEYLQIIEADINWLAQIIQARIKDESFNFDTIQPPILKTGSIYSNFIIEHKISVIERFLTILVLVPHVYPVFLQEQFSKTYMGASYSNPKFAECPKHHSAIIKSSTSDSFLPTGQTFLYLVGGKSIVKRVLCLQNILGNRFYTIANNVISPAKNSVFDPLLSNIISLSHNYALAFLTNNIKLIKNN